MAKTERFQRDSEASLVYASRSLGQARGAIHFRSGKIFVRNEAARPDEPAYITIDPQNFRLPATPFTGRPIALSERPQLVSAAYSAVRAYAERQRGSKSTHLNVVKAFRSIAKAFEFAWINGCYSMEDWSPALLSSLPSILSKGGWALALDIQRRTEELLEGKSISAIQDRYLSKNHFSERRFSVKLALQADLGSNIMQAELQPVRRVLGKKLGFPVAGSGQGGRSSDALGMNESHLRQELSWINLLSESAPPAIDFTPFQSTVAISKQLGRPSGRTANLTPTQIAELLGESFKWVEAIGPHLLDCLRLVVSVLESNRSAGIATRRLALVDFLLKSKAHDYFQSEAGFPLNGLMHSRSAPRDRSLSGAIEMLVTACFIIIALLNARRKDEIQHRKIGLTRRSREIIDKDLEIALCWFYIEKTYRDYIPMYIGRATQRAISCLESLESLTVRIAQLAGESLNLDDEGSRSLFRLPNLGVARPGKTCWFLFGIGPSFKRFIERAKISEWKNNKIAPHMFRRAYGLLFLYRFEGPILALTQKYAHLDPVDTLTYVVDPTKGPTGPAVREYSRLSEKQLLALNDDIRGIEDEIKLASDDRLEQLIHSILTGENRDSGLFAKLIWKLHNRLAGRVQYQSLTNAERLSSLSELLISRGHRFRPYWHGNCCAPSDAFAKRTPCNRDNTRGARQEFASPSVCVSCHYHHIARGHLVSIERRRDEVKEQLNEPNVSTLVWMQGAPNLANIERVIALHRRRMGHA